ncbi:MAG TPA: hypothetical protein VFR18_05370 [Terriglobia bacterium]|nr:hypothetical protein [Terriglobia bacterium]
MKNLKSVVPVSLLAIALVVLSGCHGSTGGLHKIRWVNEADSGKVIEFTLRVPTVMGRMHMAVFGGPVRGTYILKDNDKTLEGVVTQFEDSFVLISNDGKNQKFAVDRSTGALTDEAGAVWKADSPPGTTALKEATLKEW